MTLRTLLTMAFAALTATPALAGSEDGFIRKMLEQPYVPESPYDWMVLNPLDKDDWAVVYYLQLGRWGEFASPTGPNPKVDPADGAPIWLAGTIPVGCPASKTTAIHPNGRFIYLATDAGSFGNVCAFAFDRTAQTLTPVPGSPFRATDRISS